MKPHTIRWLAAMLGPIAVCDACGRIGASSEAGEVCGALEARPTNVVDPSPRTVCRGTFRPFPGPQDEAAIVKPLIDAPLIFGTRLGELHTFQGSETAEIDCELCGKSRAHRGYHR